MNHALFLSILVAAGVLAGCQSHSPDPERAVAPPEASNDATGIDPCDSATYASLVGQDKSAAPAPTEARPVRVVCSTCPMTMDYNAARLNVVFDEKTGVVQKLNCG